MKAVELLEKYPEAAKVIHEFYRNRMMNSMETDDIPDEFKEMLKQQSFDNEYIATFVDASPRMLFDMFDANNVYIEILVDLTKDNALFNYIIDGDVMDNVEATLYNSRIEAEKVAIEKAFEILNDKLCQTK
jgi:hypothetical protein